MSLYEQYETNVDKERKGTEVFLSGSTFILARAGGRNVTYAKCLEKKTRNFRRGNKLVARIDEKKSMEILREVYAETIILGWKDVPNRDGTPKEYSQQNCVELLEQLPDLFADIRDAAEERATFQDAAREEEAKN